MKVIPMRRQPFVEAYGEMMDPDGSERVGSFNSDCTFDWRFVEARTAGATSRRLTGAGGRPLSLTGTIFACF